MRHVFSRRLQPTIAGRRLRYSLEVRNAGPSNGKDVVIADRLPAAVEFDSASPGCTLGPGREVRCALGEVAVGARPSRFVAVRVPPSATGLLVNSASVVGREGEDPAPPLRTRPVYDPTLGEFVDTPVYNGSVLRAGNRLAGPAVIEYPGTTVAMVSGQVGTIDRYLGIEIRRAP